MSREIDEAEPMDWERVVPPLWWAAAGRFIVADRHLPDGTRQHMVSGHVPAGLVVTNAQVIGQVDVRYPTYAERLSHLSKDKKPTA